MPKPDDWGAHINVTGFLFLDRAAAERLRASLINEDGCAAAVRASHANLPASRMQSDLGPSLATCYRLDRYNLHVSRPVARVLLSDGGETSG